MATAGANDAAHGGNAPAATSASRASSSRQAPGPSGGLLGWRNFFRVQSNRVEWYDELRRQFGDVVSFHVGPMRFFQFTHPDAVGELLVKHSLSLHKPRLVRWYFGRWMGDGLLLNEGRPWQEQRRKVRSALQQVPAELRGSLVARLAQQVIAPSGDRPIDIAATIDRLAFYLNVHTLLGDDAKDVAGELYDAANEIHATGVREISRLNVLPDWLPLPSKLRLRRAMRVFDEVLLSLASRRRDSHPPANDLLAGLLAAHDRQGGSRGMSVKQARDEAVNLLMGGKETVGAVLTWSSYLLATHQEVQRLVATEVRSVLQGSEATVDDLSRLPQIQQVIQETMRLYPPVALLAREVVAPLEAGGCRLRRGDQVMIPVYSIHRDERWFADPLRFLPDRFGEAPMAARPRYAFIPFGAGPRACVGKQLGFQQCVLALAWLVANFELDILPGQSPPTLKMDIVLHPSDPLRLTLSPRAKRPAQDSAGPSAAGEPRGS